MLSKESFHQHWIKEFSDVALRNTHFFVAISGGADSVVLAHLLHTLGASIELVHANFQLRGAESKRDQDFVIQYAKNLGVHCNTQIFDTQQYAQMYQMGIQEAAREIRYAWFSRLLEESREKSKFSEK